MQERDQLSASLAVSRQAEQRLSRDLAVQTAAAQAEQSTVATLRSQLSEATAAATTASSQHETAAGTWRAGPYIPPPPPRAVLLPTPRPHAHTRLLPVQYRPLCPISECSYCTW